MILFEQQGVNETKYKCQCCDVQAQQPTLAILMLGERYPEPVNIAEKIEFRATKT